MDFLWVEVDAKVLDALLSVSSRTAQQLTSLNMMGFLCQGLLGRHDCHVTSMLLLRYVQSSSSKKMMLGFIYAQHVFLAIREVFCYLQVSYTEECSLGSPRSLLIGSW
ncbi:uncharacterized protein LOC141863495 isoform X2 [Acropora palmata]